MPNPSTECTMCLIIGCSEPQHTSPLYSGCMHFSAVLRGHTACALQGDPCMDGDAPAEQRPAYSACWTDNSQVACLKSTCN